MEIHCTIIRREEALEYGLRNRSKLFWGISDLGNTIHGAGNE